jgi:predicted DNA-binding ribbon-helix-helix protein
MSALVNRNVFIGERRTSIRLEPRFWELLSEIATLENRTIHDICRSVAAGHTTGGGFTTAVRVYVVNFWRERVTP